MKEQQKGSWLTELSLEWATCESALVVAAFSIDREGEEGFGGWRSSPGAWGAQGMVSSPWGARTGQ